MKKLTANEIRKMWIEFFTKNDHYYVEPKSLIPYNDDSLLWINSGVATLKSYFDGSANPPAPRLTNVQKSLRTNDVSNVGVTSRHHTLFEMLGNFSIGDYFKEKALQLGLEFLVSPDFLNIDIDKLYFTIYEKDDEALKILQNLNISQNHIILAPRSTNFWDMGQGPCGPNCEIFYDRGEKFDFENIGTDLIKYDYDHNERFIEIWNIVFSEFNNDGNNNYTKLPRQNIDTGAGFERLVSISQGGYTNFDSDLFLPLINKLEEFSPKKYDANNYFVKNEVQSAINTAYKVIVDHIRAVVFAIADGAYPSNESRGYVLRRLIRRSMLFAKKLEIEDNVLHLLVEVIVENYGEFYTNLVEFKKLIIDVILKEEESFAKTIKQGQKNINKLITQKQTLTGHDVFVLYDTYGFPFELSKEIALEQGIVINEEDFKKELEKQRIQSKQASNISSGMKQQSLTLTKLNVNSKFVGFDKTNVNSKINAIFDDLNFYDHAKNTTLNICFEQTVFYATKGGQSADKGIILKDSNVIGTVIDVILGPNNEHIHVISLNEEIKLGEEVTLQVNETSRQKISSNHSATHIVHQVLFNKLGKNLKQAGSFQDDLKSRFDFSVFAKFDKYELMKEVEDNVNKIISQKLDIITTEEEFAKAKENPRLFAEFEAKYDDLVRVVSIGDFNFELCGGTHVKNTSQIEKVFIRNISSKGSNVYRVEFITTNALIQEELKIIKSDFIKQLSSLTTSQAQNLVEKIKSQENLNQEFVISTLKNITKIKKEAKKQQTKVSSLEIEQLNKNNFKDVDIYINTFENQDINFLRSCGDLCAKHSKKFIAVTLNTGLKNTIIISCSSEFNANTIMKQLTDILDCRGGGKAHMAQGNFQKTANIQDILETIKVGL